MKVIDLRCTNDHRFEGWFGSEEDLQSQSERGLVQCPVCADAAITRMPSAPRLNVSALRTEPAVAPATPDAAHHMQSLWLRTLRRVMDSTEDVGDRFPEEARRIHYGEIEERGIRGQATAEQAKALKDEGIEVVALPVPAALKGPVQ
jgi:hypothetical protein